MSFFTKTFEFKGKHAEMVRTLADVNALNCKNVEVFLMSISLGIARNLKSKIDNSSTNVQATILAEQMVGHSDNIEYFYKLLMLSDETYCPSAEERCNKAFRYLGTDEAERDEKHFTEVLLGGLEFLYSQIMENTTSKNDIFKNICDFVETCE